MLTLAKVKASKGNKPYSQPLKVKVCGVSSTARYQVESGEKKEYCVIGIADHSMAMKATLYDISKKANLAEGTSVIVMNYIHKTEPTEGIIIPKNTKVMKTFDVDVPTEIQRQGALIANPPPAETLTIKQVKRSPIKSLVSVKGTVISVSMNLCYLINISIYIN